LLRVCASFDTTINEEELHMGSANEDKSPERQAERPQTRSASLKPHYRPNQDEDRKAVEGHPNESGVGREPRGVQKGIADADDKARAAAGAKEPVRNTPPAGDWNDTMPE
jgi:hypothetical protein